MGLRERIEFARARDLTAGTFFERLATVHGPDTPLVEESPLDGSPGLRLTYGHAAECVASWAGALRTRIEPGQPVVVALPNGYGIFLLSLAVARAGGLAVPVNPKMRDEEIEHVVRDAGTDVIVRDLSEMHGGEPVDAAATHPGDVAALFYTSGTTGYPKGAELSHEALVGRISLGALNPAQLRRDEAVSGMPVAHIAGFSMLVQFATLGLSVYLLRKFRPDDALEAIESRRASMFVGVPAMYRMMIEAGAETRDLSSVRLWASGADTMPFELARAFQRFGAAATLPIVNRPVGDAMFVDGYGMVELGGGVAVSVLPPGVALPLRGLMGVPLPGYRMKVVDEHGEEVGRGDVGELAVTGPGVMRGYHKREDATAETMTSDGWLRTGDLARRNRLGLVELAGRKKDVIKHGGYSVFAAEVEGALEQHPAVAEAAVIGLPDARKGEVPVAVVRRADGASLTADELMAWAARRLSDYKMPQRVVFVDELPRTGTEKVRKQDLGALFDAE
jgi:acyl-CoA synthetase (AMP-forming)/AMP-acid ligase II